MVVSSYGTILAITDYPKEVVQNLKRLEAQDMYGKYGFFESIDYTPSRIPIRKDKSSCRNIYGTPSSVNIAFN